MSKTPIADMVSQMLAAGVPHDSIVLAIKTTEACQNGSARPQNISAAALRMRKFRAKKRGVTGDVTKSVTHETNTLKNNDLVRNTVTSRVTPIVTPPIEPPFKKDKKEEEDSKRLPPAVLRVQQAQPEVTQDGFVSEDGTINFTASDIALLEAQCPLLANVRGSIVNLAETDWIARKVAPYDRTRAIRAKLKKDQRIEAEKQIKVVTPKQVAAVAAIKQAAADDMEKARQRALEVRRRHGVGGCHG
jgi:hypothetical protein